jgi:hypothetical protein
MTRIEPTHFIEQYDGGICGMQNTKVSPIDLLSETLKHTESKRYLYTTAIFLIKPSNLSLEERMSKREMKRCVWIKSYYCKFECCPSF